VVVWESVPVAQVAPLALQFAGLVVEVVLSLRQIHCQVHVQRRLEEVAEEQTARCCCRTFVTSQIGKGRFGLSLWFLFLSSV
jgi:hypothetical protein